MFPPLSSVGRWIVVPPLLMKKMKMACVRAIADMALKESHGEVAEAYVGEES